MFDLLALLFGSIFLTFGKVHIHAYDQCVINSSSPVPENINDECGIGSPTNVTGIITCNSQDPMANIGCANYCSTNCSVLESTGPGGILFKIKIISNTIQFVYYSSCNQSACGADSNDDQSNCNFYITNVNSTKINGMLYMYVYIDTGNDANICQSTSTYTSKSSPTNTTQASQSFQYNCIVAGISAPLFLLLSSVVFILALVLFWNYRKRSTKLEQDSDQQDGSHTSMSSRGSSNQFGLIQSSFNDIHEPNSPNGETSFIARSTEEDERISNTYTELPLVNVDPIYSHIVTERQITTHQDQDQELDIIPNQNAVESNPAEATYAVVDKSKKGKREEKMMEEKKSLDAPGPPVPAYNPVESSDTGQEERVSVMNQENKAQPTVEEMYTAVNKKKKREKSSKEEEEVEALPIPPHTVEELYTDGKTKSKGTKLVDDDAPPVPPHSVEELYTTVKKNLKVSTPQDEGDAPPISAHTVEELYTAVQKQTKAFTTDDEEEAPPVPPYIGDQL